MTLLLKPDVDLPVPADRIREAWDSQRSTHHDVEGRPRRTLAQCAEEFTTCSLPVRELVARIPAPRRDHGKSKDSAVKEQFRISARVAIADIFGDMGEVELDGPTAARFKIDEQQSGLRTEHVARVRLAVQELLVSAAATDRLSLAP